MLVPPRMRHRLPASLLPLATRGGTLRDLGSEATPHGYFAPSCLSHAANLGWSAAPLIRGALGAQRALLLDYGGSVAHELRGGEAVLT